jgi:hypothetical protein
LRKNSITLIEGSVNELLYDEKNPNKVIGVKYQQKEQQQVMINFKVTID